LPIWPELGGERDYSYWAQEEEVARGLVFAAGSTQTSLRRLMAAISLMIQLYFNK
jgi:hypothetical protein